MEEMSKTMGQLPSWHKTTHIPPCSDQVKSGFETMAPSNLPLAPGNSFQVWRKPYLKSFMIETRTAMAKTTSSVQPNSDANPNNPHVLAIIIDGNNKKNQDGVVENNTSAITTDEPVAVDGNNSQLMDPRKLKRIISNRVSAQKSRMKKLQYVTDMERRVKALEAQIAVLSPQVSAYKNQQHMLQMEQNSLNQRMTALTNNKLIKDAEIEENKVEVTRLRQLHLKLQQHQLQAHSRMLNWESGGLEQILNTGLNQPAGFGHNIGLLINSNQAQVGDVTAEVNNLNQLNMTQQQQQHEERLGQSWMGGNDWEVSPKQNMQNTSSNQSALLVPQQKMNLNSNFGGVEQMLSLNTINSEPRNCFI